MSNKIKDKEYVGVYTRANKNNTNTYYIRFKHKNKNIERVVNVNSPYQAHKRRLEMIYELKHTNTSDVLKKDSLITLEYVFNKYCEDSLKYNRVKERTLSSKRSLFKKFEKLHYKDIRDITKDEIEQCIKESNYKSNTTFNNCVNFISMLYYFCLNEDICVVKNQSIKIKKKTEDSEREKTLSKEQIKRMFILIDNRLNQEDYDDDIERLSQVKLFLQISLNTGLRLSEVCRLQVKDIDRTDRKLRVYNRKRDRHYTITIRNSLYETLKYRIQSLNRNDYIIDYYKSKDLVKQVQRRLSNILNNLFNRTELKTKSDYFKNMSDYEIYRYREQLEIDLFTTRMLYKDNSHIFEYEDNIKYKIVIHSLRHTFATILLNDSNYSIYEVKDMLNHSSIKTTERYTKLIRDEEKDREDLF